MTMSESRTATCTAPVNIAVVKYWGKRDENLVLPINSSLSVTLDQNELCATTSVCASSYFTKDRMWLNNEEIDISTSRFQSVLKCVRERSKLLKERHNSGKDEPLHLHICSENNFPTAAGLASSAAGLACLVYTLSKVLDVDEDLSKIARLGSGSACRSVYGGFVAWDMGIKKDGDDSKARQIAPHTHWPELAVLILVVSGKKKPIGSTAGMQTSVKTSDLLHYRATEIIPTRMENMIEAILNKDFQTFADITMKDSNQLHAVCLDTYPPISYLNDTSKMIIQLVHSINNYFKENRVAYTFDAGPNACLYLLKKDVPMMLTVINNIFPTSQGDCKNSVRGTLEEDINPETETLTKEFLQSVQFPTMPDALQYLILTKAGPGPQQLNQEKSLLNEKGLLTEHSPRAAFLMFK